MQPINISTVKAAKATDRRALAILAYDNATADPAGANWRAVAEILRLALPAVKAKAAAAEIVTDSRFAPFSEHDIPVFGHAKKFGKSPILVITFADGEAVRAPAVSLPGKPVNVGRALRVAFAYYRGRIAHRCGAFSETAACVAIPDIVSVICETTAAEYDPADCSARTAEIRAGTFDYFTALAAAWDGDSVGTVDCPDIADYVRTEYLKASHALRFPVAPAEYSDFDAVAAFNWLQDRLAVRQAIADSKYPNRMAYAVMTLMPGLTDSELSAVPVVPAEIAPLATAPVAPSFKVRPAFLATSRLTLVSSNPPVAPSRGPSCILRIAA